MRFWVNKLRTPLSLTRGQGVQLKGHLIIGEKPTLSFFFFQISVKKNFIGNTGLVIFTS